MGAVQQTAEVTTRDGDRGRTSSSTRFLHSTVVLKEVKDYNGLEMQRLIGACGLRVHDHNLYDQTRAGCVSRRYAGRVLGPTHYVRLCVTLIRIVAAGSHKNDMFAGWISQRSCANGDPGDRGGRAAREGPLLKTCPTLKQQALPYLVPSRQPWAPL